MTAKFAPPGVVLPPHAPDALCPKCGNADVGTHYYPDGCEEDDCWSHDREHLRRHCRKCNYEWAEAVGVVTLTSATSNWKAAYELKAKDFAAETLKNSKLIGALHELGCRSVPVLIHTWCSGCQALREVGAVDPVAADAEDFHAP
jgi:hypothetical protein